MYKNSCPIIYGRFHHFVQDVVEYGMASLYLVATPIGNLDDISKRCADTLANVDLVLAEDTRVAKKLLDRLEINKQLKSYHQHTSDEVKYEILKLLLEGKDIALVSDAGTPGINDPGNELVDFLVRNQPAIKIVPIPGPSAVSAALSVCGFNVSQYIFLGFWPKKKASKIIKVVQNNPIPFVFFESPYRIIKTLALLSESLGNDRRIFIGRELTKLHETHYRGTINEVKSGLAAEKFLKGEIVVVVE